jgi:acetylornithine deacetylase/succinyl-diaminopimelate desuccinylase-like protein
VTASARVRWQVRRDVADEPATTRVSVSAEAEQTVEAVLGRIEDAREEIADLALTLANTFGPVGRERPVAQAVDDWYREQGIESAIVELSPERANTVARLRGSQSGAALIFNAHLDTEASGPDYDNLMGIPDPNQVGAWREGDQLFGHTILNDRGAMALFMVAAKAVRDAGVPLRKDIILSSVSGETGQAPVDEYQGPQYEGKGYGSSLLVEQGVRGEFALVAETTDFALCWYNCGAAYYKVTVRGQNMYTPRLRRPDRLGLHPNAIVKAAHVVEAIEGWAVKYEERHAQATPCGEVRPKAQVGAIRGGIPWRPNRSSPYCALYVDVRLLPGQDVDAVTESLSSAIADAGVEAEIDLIMAKQGAVATGIEPLADAVVRAHQFVRGAPPPPRAEVAVVSMWRDTNVFNRSGIPALTFGPSRGAADVQGRGHFELNDLVDCAKMYALVAMQLATEFPAEALELAPSASPQ